MGLWRRYVRLAALAALGLAALLPGGSRDVSAERPASPTPQPNTPAAVAAATGCARARLQAGGTARWLENCGRVALNGSPEQIARAALAPRAAALGLSADGRDLDVLSVREVAPATFVRFRQSYRGVPVYLGQVVVQYSRSGEVQLINNHTLADLTLSIMPEIGAADALDTARAAVDGEERAPARSELVIYGTARGPRLAWHITIYAARPAGDWHVIVDAASGKILSRADQLRSDSGSGRAYAPNPIQQSGSVDLADNNDAASAILNSSRVTVTLANLDAGTFKLKGSAVDLTGPGVAGCTLPYTPGLADEPSRVYSYTRDDDRFEEVNVYAAIDGVQSWIQSLGFNNVHNRPIAVDAHCNSDENSYFSDSDMALHFGDGAVDSAEDSDIVVHEYGHAIQEDQVPGWGPGDNTEQRALGEGFSDFLAAMYYLDKGDPAFLADYKYCIAEWDAVAYNPVLPGNSGTGCLRWIDGRSEGDGEDIGAYSGTPAQEHDDGRFWSATLTCVYQGMGANPAARDAIMRLVLAHHFSLTPDTSNGAFDDAVAALLLADGNLYSGEHQELINACARQRNLLDLPAVPAPALVYPSGGETIVAGEAVTITWQTNGAPSNATYVLEYTADCTITPTFTDTVENGANGWTVRRNGGLSDWARVTDRAFSPVSSWFARNEAALSYQFLTSPEIPIAAGDRLFFTHQYNLEDEYDGGVVELSSDGVIWYDLGVDMRSNGYNMVIDPQSTTALAGAPAFSGFSDGWLTTEVDLSSYAGQTVRVRFWQADDDTTAYEGWWIDDIAVRKLRTWVPIATSAPGASSLRWTTPATLGTDYCVRIRGQAPDHTPSAFVSGAPFSLVADLGARVWMPRIMR